MTMTKVKIGKMSDIPPNRMIAVDALDKKILVANLDGRLYAMDGLCTHAAGHLWEGKLVGTTVKCPKHGSEFDVRTGKVIKGPWVPFGRASDLRTYAVNVEGDEIFVNMI